MFTEEELSKLQELRSVLPSSLLPKDLFSDDYYLIRWLRARNLDVSKAAQMLEKSIQWRTENQIDLAIENGEEVPLKYRKIYPTGLLGHDDEDCLVVFLPLGRFNHRIMIGNEGMETAMRYNMLWMERIMGYLKEYEEKTGKKGLRIVEVVDMEYYSYKELTYGPAREFMLATNRVFDENYPELLKSCIVINAPKVFTMLWNIIKPLLSKVTMSKVQIYGGSGQEVESWKELLRSKLKPENVPKRWGGTKQGSDEFCSQDKDVWIDGPIELSYFIDGYNEKRVDGLKTEKVKARDKTVIEFPVDIPTSEASKNSAKLTWKVQVDSHDINYSITFQPTTKDETKNEGMLVIQSESRVDSKQGVQNGSYKIDNTLAAGIYFLTFDNKFSYTRSKTVHYSIEVEQATVTNE